MRVSDFTEKVSQGTYLTGYGNKCDARAFLYFTHVHAVSHRTD